MQHKIVVEKKMLPPVRQESMLCSYPPFITDGPNSFNASERFLHLGAVHQKMAEEFYNSLGLLPRHQSVSLQNHFVEWYGACIPGIRTTPLVEGYMKCPSTLVKGDQEMES
jgi:hypothetical protein